MEVLAVIDTIKNFLWKISKKYVNKLYDVFEKMKTIRFHYNCPFCRVWKKISSDVIKPAKIQLTNIKIHLSREKNINATSPIYDEKFNCQYRSNNENVSSEVIFIMFWFNEFTNILFSTSLL